MKLSEGAALSAPAAMVYSDLPGKKQPPREMAAIHPAASKRWSLLIWGRPMHGWILGLFLFTTFFGGIVTGLAGFAMGLVVSGVWLHILTPAQTASLIVGYGLLTQSYNIWKLRHALNWRTVAPFVIGGLIGVPIGAALVTYVDPNYVRTGVGVLLIVYSALFAGAAAPQAAQRPALPWTPASASSTACWAE